jgi:hypothetical protein
MRPYHIRTDLIRRRSGAFRWPLGLVGDDLPEPVQGYTLTLSEATDSSPEAFTFHIVVSHEQLAALVGRLLDLLPDEVFGIAELGSRDAYRSLDTFLSAETITWERFRYAWDHYQQFLLEDCSIGVGANSDDPLLEVYVDPDKAIHLQVPMSMCQDVQELLGELGLNEVEKIWPKELPDDRSGSVRSVLAVGEGLAWDVEEILGALRGAWSLLLDVDPDRNLDDSGRELGITLWHSVVEVESVAAPGLVGHISIWGTASSLRAMEEITEQVLSARPEWSTRLVVAIDRAAYDERPDQLVDMPPRFGRDGIHLIQFLPAFVQEVVDDIQDP